MPDPIAYFNGRYLPQSQLAVSVDDTGFLLGAVVSERIRTFRGELYRLDEHLTRLARSLEIVGIEPGLGADQFAQIAQHISTRNHQLVEPGDDLGLSLFVTPGPSPTFSAAEQLGPTVCLHTYPLPFSNWASVYSQGQILATTDIQQVPAACWPPELKCRSRMHYFLADRQAAARYRGARALLTDAEGFVVEASTANLVVYDPAEGLSAPPLDAVLPGVSERVLAGLAAELKVPFRHRQLTVEDVAASAEAMLCSTSSCMLPVVQLNDRLIGGGQPGPMYRRILAAWSESVGVDIQAQAERFRDRLA